MGLVDREQGARVARRPAELLVVSRLGEQEPGVGYRGLGQDEGHVAGLERGLERGGVVELDDPGLAGDSRRETPAFGNDLRALPDYERRVSFAVVLAVEHQDDLPSRQLASEADHLGIGLGGWRVNCHFGSS